jgi:hypothetical protein
MVAITQMCEPRGNLAGFSILEQLMDTAPAQARRGGDLPDGEAGVRRGNNSSDPLVFGLVQPRRRQAQALVGLLVVQEVLSAFFSGVHVPRIPVSSSSVQQTGRVSVLFCSAAPGRPVSKVEMD